MQNTIIYLIGYPAVGKLTVAKALCTKTGARLFDNHLVNNVAFALTGTDGPAPVPEAVWDEIRTIRDAALRIVARHAPPHLSYVLTNVLLEAPDDRALFAQVAGAAARRRALFVPVVLDCQLEENLRRVALPGRIKALKETGTGVARRRRRTEPLLDFSHPNRFDLDITHLVPDQAAKRIIAHIKSLHK